MALVSHVQPRPCSEGTGQQVPWGGGRKASGVALRLRPGQARAKRAAGPAPREVDRSWSQHTWEETCTPRHTHTQPSNPAPEDPEDPCPAALATVQGIRLGLGSSLGGCCCPGPTDAHSLQWGPKARRGSCASGAPWGRGSRRWAHPHPALPASAGACQACPPAEAGAEGKDRCGRGLGEMKAQAPRGPPALAWRPGQCRPQSAQLSGGWGGPAARRGTRGGSSSLLLTGLGRRLSTGVGAWGPALAGVPTRERTPPPSAQADAEDTVPGAAGASRERWGSLRAQHGEGPRPAAHGPQDPAGLRWQVALPGGGDLWPRTCVAGRLLTGFRQGPRTPPAAEVWRPPPPPPRQGLSPATPGCRGPGGRWCRAATRCALPPVLRSRSPAAPAAQVLAAGQGPRSPRPGT